MRFVIVTGMSGAGKSTALKMLEDMGYFCVDNLPIPLLTRFVEMFSEPEEEVKKIALGIDVRGGQDFTGLKEVLDDLDSREIEYEILFLDASDDVLVKRYKETRRKHPLSGSGRVDTGIAIEREKIMFLKMRATYIPGLCHGKRQIENISEETGRYGGIPDPELYTGREKSACHSDRVYGRKAPFRDACQRAVSDTG